MAMLSMEDISISFYGTYANEHVNLSVEKGEIHALLGENGAGKTTLMPSPAAFCGKARKCISIRRWKPFRRASAWCISTSPWSMP